jgi:ferredoxin-NADP reductase/predicted pyridoxine 5'-phosphate oxidase superfamily flavin-nucleotide-binding protein
MAISRQTFHPGEIQMQQAILGVLTAAQHRAAVSPLIREHMPQQHSDFYGEAPFLIASSLDADGWPRASILQRRERRAPILRPLADGRAFVLEAGAVMAGDSFAANVAADGAPVGILGIELATRRRNRVNGHVIRVPLFAGPAAGADAGGTAAAMVVRVTHSFGNCPKYITARDLAERTADETEPFSKKYFTHPRNVDGADEGLSSFESIGFPGVLPPPSEGDDASEQFERQVRVLFGSATTLFIASGSKEIGVDVSHRGGPAGFVRVVETNAADSAAAAVGHDGDGAEATTHKAASGQLELRMPDYQVRLGPCARRARRPQIHTSISSSSSLILALRLHCIPSHPIASHRSVPLVWCTRSQGNNFMNTLGNIALEPRVSLLLIDFQSGAIAQLRGVARVEMASDPKLPGSLRVIAIRPIALELTRGALALTFGAPTASPFNPPSSADEGDQLELVSVRDENLSGSMRTLTFCIGRPITYRPGQHGSFLLQGEAVSATEGATTTAAPGGAAAAEIGALVPSSVGLTRAWTLSSSPSSKFGDTQFSITVKRKPGGRASQLLHGPPETLRALSFRLRGVDGEFTLPLDALPGKTLVLAAAGSGITPVISMLRAMALGAIAEEPPAQASAAQPMRAAVLYVVQSTKELPFAAELAALASETRRIAIVLTREASADVQPQEWLRYFKADAGQSRLTAEALDYALGERADIARAYACGPGGFAPAVEALLEAAGHRHEVITESFDF